MDNIRNVYGPYPYDCQYTAAGDILKYPKSPRYDVTGDHMVEGAIFAGRLVVDEGANLHMKDYEAGSGGTNGGVIEAQEIQVNGTIQLDQPSNDWAPAQIRIYNDGNLSLGNNGSIQAAKGSELILQTNATCNDAAKALLYKNDGENIVPFDLNANHEQLKFIFDNGKWIYQEPAFGVDYDEWLKYDEELNRDVATASVSANGNVLARGEMMPFTEGEEITFSFTMPEERAGQTPYICIESGGYWRGSWVDGDDKLNVTGNSFTFTPPNSDEFWVRFWWSDYDFFGPSDNEFMVETRGNGGGTVSANLTNVNGVNSKDEPVEHGGKKQIFNREALTNTLNNKITFTFTPDENNRLNEVEFWYDGLNDAVRYSLRNEDGKEPINAANGFSENGGVYTYTFDFTGIDTSHISVNANFEDTQNSWIKENKYFVEYDPWGHWDDEQKEDVYTAFVKKDGAVVDRYDDNDDSTLYDYTIGDTYTFLLEGPEERSGCTPIVDIETGLGEFYSSDANRADDSHRITLTNNSFSFTPQDKYGFMIRVNWSDYDCFNPEGEEEFLVDINGDNGTVTADLSNVTIIRSMNEPNDRAGKKYIINRSEIGTKLNNKIIFTFTPNENTRLSGVDFWLDRQEDEKRFSLRKDDDPNRELINEENGFTEDNGVYTYTFNLSGIDTGHITASAWFENIQDLWIAENEYRIRYNEFGGPEDELPGRAFVNNVYVSSCDDENERLNYTVGEAINFKLELPANRTGCTPIVEINTERGEYYSSKQGDVDDNHYIKLNSDNTFSFTPTDKYGFDIWINWSDFDAFWYDNNNEFLIMADHYSDGNVSITKEPKDSFVGDNEDMGVKYLYDNNALEGEDIRVKMTPNDGFYVASVWLRIDRPEQDYFDAFYVSGEPGGEDRDMFEDGSGFSKEGDIVYYTVPKDVEGAFVIMSIEYREEHDDIRIDGKGRKVEYRVDNASTYTALPDDSDTIPKDAFDNADVIQFKFSNLNGDERGVRVIITDYYQYSWLNSLEDDGTYTIRKSDIGGKWKGIEVELIDWITPMNDQYMIQWFGAEDVMDSANGLERDKVYDIPESGPITLMFNEPVYAVIVEPDWSERIRLNPDSNSMGRAFSYTPEDSRALTFKVYPTEEEYNYFENINPNHEQNQFSAEYDVNIHLDENNKTIPGLGGTVTYNVDTIDVGGLIETVKQHHFVRNKNKLILQGGENGITSITLTITPNIGCDYEIFVRDENITEQVKANGNKYVWDVSEPWNIPWLCVDFHQGNTPLSGTVTVNGIAKYGEELTAAVTGDVNEEAIKYQWYRGDVAIEGATEATYTTVKDDISKVVSCKVTSVLQSGELSGTTSTAIAKADGQEAPTGLEGVATSIAGYVDGKITGVSVLMEYATKSDFSDKKDIESTEITGLAAGTYYVRFKETDTRESGASIAVTVTDGPEMFYASLDIVGKLQYGQTLTAEITESNATEFTYQWYRADSPISGETSSTYTLVKEDIGKEISCEISDKSGIHPGSLGIKKITLVAKADGPAAPTGLEGIAPSKAGSADGKITGTSVLMEYATKEDFSDVKSCTGTEITGLKAGTYYVRMKESDTHEVGSGIAVTINDGKADITGTVSISGTAKFGQTLTAKVTGSNASNFSYQWKRGSNVISNASASTYKLVKEDIGQTITCVVTDKSGNTLGSISGTSAKIEKADGPAAPSNLKGVACTKKGASDGKITGVSTSMEYATKSDFSDKKKCSSTEITGLKAGTYYVRIAETDTTKVGSSTTVTVEDAKEQTQDELVTDFVKRFYKEVLGRSDKAIEEDEAGITDWANKLINKEKTGAQVAQGFVNSKEFKNRGVSDEEYVTIMYIAFFGRDPDEGGYNGWLSKLKSGTSREAVLAGFTNSKEFQNLCAKYGIEPGKLDTNGQSQQNNNQQNNNQQNNNNQSGMRPPLKLDSSNVDEKQLDDFVERLYDKVLGRNSDEGGKTYWLSAIMEGHDDRGNTYDAAIAIRKGFFESKEYLNKGRNDDEFLTDLYWAFFNREPDAEGYAYWQNKMKNEGYTRQRVIDEGFGHSKEFKNLLTSYGFIILE